MTNKQARGIVLGALATALGLVACGETVTLGLGGSASSSSSTTTGTASGMTSSTSSTITASYGFGFGGSSAGDLGCVSGQRTTLVDRVFANTRAALDDTYAYWGNQVGSSPGPYAWQIMRAPKEGGAAEVVVSGSGLVASVSSDATRLYWIEYPPYGPNQKNLMVVDKGGGVPVVLYTSDQWLEFNAADPDTIIVLDGWPSSAWSIVALPKDGGPTTVLASGTSAIAAPSIAADADRVYWLDSDSSGLRVMSILKAGGPSAVVCAAAGPSGMSRLVVDDERVYWAGTTTFLSSAIFSAPKGGGLATMLAQPNMSVTDIAVDDACLYWTGDTGATDPATGNHVGLVAAIPKSGGSAARIHGGMLEARDLAIDESGLYLTAPAATQPPDWNKVNVPALMGAVDKVPR
jgi:hypothetical protein